MTKRGGYWATATAIALLMTGCSAPAAETVETATSEQTTVETAAPLTVDETPAPAEASADDTKYLEEVRLRLKQAQSAEDASLLAAAQDACAMYEQGMPREEMRFIEGEEPEDGLDVYWDSTVIATWAAKVYCPEFDS